MNASTKLFHPLLKGFVPRLKLSKYGVAQSPAVPEKKPRATLIHLASSFFKSGCSVAQLVKWAKNRRASILLCPLKRSGLFILEWLGELFCRLAVRAATCCTSACTSCSVVAGGVDIGVCGCAGVRLWDTAGAGGGGVAEVEAGFEER